MKIFVIAGEASGDRLGAALLQGLTQRRPDLVFDGVGGPLMAQQGLCSRFPMDELSVMGIWEILPRYRALRARIAQTAQAVIESGAGLMIGIDSPDFCLRVGRLVRKARPDFPIVHYVAPSVWAWRAGRAQRMAQTVDHVLALLPFEPPLMQAAGMSCDFVGHPVTASPPPDAEAGRALRSQYGIADEAPLVMVLPGSRRGEIARIGPHLGGALALLREEMPDLRAILPTLPHLRGQIDALIAGWDRPPVVVETAPDRSAAFAAADLALAASGTVSLELAQARVPMVIAYDMAPLSRWIIGRMMRLDTVTLVNLVSETRAVPECLGTRCRAAPIAAAARAVMHDDDARSAQIAAMELTMQRLGEGGPPPGLRAADSVLRFAQSREVIQPPPSTRVPSGA